MIFIFIVKLLQMFILYNVDIVLFQVPGNFILAAVYSKMFYSLSHLTFIESCHNTFAISKHLLTTLGSLLL